LIVGVESTELEIFHLEKELESIIEEERITEQVKETENEEIEAGIHQEEIQIETNNNVEDTDSEYEELEEEDHCEMETVASDTTGSHSVEATEYEEMATGQEFEEIPVNQLEYQTEKADNEELEELEESFILNEITETPETVEIAKDLQLEYEIHSIEQSIVPSEETNSLSEMIDIENTSIQPFPDISISQSIEIMYTDDVPQQQSFGLSFNDQYSHNFSLNLLDTEINTLEKMLEEVDSPRLLTQFHPQIEDDGKQFLEVQTSHTIHDHDSSLELVSQGPTLPEPPPYDFQAELDALEEEQENISEVSILRSLEKAQRIQLAANIDLTKQKLNVHNTQFTKDIQKATSTKKISKSANKSLKINQQPLDYFSYPKTNKHTEDKLGVLKSLEQRIIQFNLRMKFNEYFKQPTPDVFLKTFQELYDEGISKGKTFVRNTETNYFYLEDYTELATDIKLHSVLFDPNAPSRVPLDQPLISLVGGGSRNTVGLKDKLQFLQSGKRLKGTYFFIKGKHFGGKDHWSKSLRYTSSQNKRDITKILFDGMMELVRDEDKIREIRRINGLANRKYNSLNIYKIKHSLKDVEKVITAKLFEIYSTKTFSRKMRHSVRNRIKKLSCDFTTGGITNINFIVYHVELNQVVNRLMSINHNNLLKVEPGELAKQIVQILLSESKPLNVSRSDTNTINLFKHVNNSKYSLNDKRFIQVANRSEKTKSGFLKCWYEACPEAWMNVVTRYMLQDPKFRKVLKLDCQEDISSIYTGQGRISKGVEPSGFPDISTIDVNGKAIDITQVKQLGYNKPNEAVDLFRDISKTLGWDNSQGVKTALNSFVFESSDIARLNQLEKFGHNNVVIIGRWGNIKGLTRFGEAVEAARIQKNVVSTSRISSMYLSKKINSSIDISKKLKKNWNLIKCVKLEGLTPISSDLLIKIKDEANLYSDPTEFYIAMIQLIGTHVLKNE
jgi:hypothetical protein